MSRNASQPIGAVAVGVAIGLLVGVAAALLLAPVDGYETRRALRRRVRHVGRRGRDAWLDLRDELRRARRKLKRARLARRLDAGDADPPPEIVG